MRFREGRLPQRLGGIPVVFAVALLVWTAAPRTALAWFDSGELLLDDTAAVLERGEIRLGIWKAGYGPLEWLTVESHTVPWFLKAPTLGVRARVFQGEDWSVMVRAGALHLNLQNLDSSTPPAKVTVIPLEVWGSRVVASRFALSAGLIYTAISMQGQYDESSLKGAAGSSNLQAALTFQVRLGRQVALYLKSRHLLYLGADVQARSVQQIDPYTQLEIVGSASSGDVAGLGFPNAFSLVPGIAWSRKYFNLLFGLGYGNWSLPLLNFVVPSKSVVAEVDLYWRW